MSSGYPEAKDYLLELKRRGVQPGLERIRRFLVELGHPERAVPCVHIAGTNGKGSVAAMLEAILRTAGWRTGLYTSPHLVRLAERIQVNRQPISCEQLARGVNELRPVAGALAAREGDAIHPSYFEFMTALAFRHFAREGCDIAIIEAGMGGRVDATNVVVPEVSVITSVGLDHCEFLGSTLEAIATEKAGIIKPGRPVVIGLLPADAERVIRSVAKDIGAPIGSVAERFGADGSGLPTTNLTGAHQRANAATATVVAEMLGARWRLSPPLIAHTLRQVEWPGRWQRIRAGDRTVILDGAHNADGASALSASLAELVSQTGRPPVAVFGALGQTRAKPLLEALCAHARGIHLVVPRQSRACSLPELEALAPPGCAARLHRATVEALFPAPASCAAGVPGDTVVVTGSLYLVGEVLARLDPSLGLFEPQLQDF